MPPSTRPRTDPPANSTGPVRGRPATSAGPNTRTTTPAALSTSRTETRSWTGSTRRTGRPTSSGSSSTAATARPCRSGRCAGRPGRPPASLSTRSPGSDRGRVYPPETTRPGLRYRPLRRLRGPTRKGPAPPMPKDSLNTTEAAAEINRLAELHGSRRRIRPDTLRDWRTDRKGPTYRKVSGWFVEYDLTALRAWTLAVYLGLAIDRDADSGEP